MGSLKSLNLNRRRLIKRLIRLSLAVLLTVALTQVTPSHIYKNFPPSHKVKALSAETNVPTETHKPKASPPAKPVKPARAETQAEARPKPTTAPVVQPPAPVTPVAGCGSDPNMAYIYFHESHCNTAAVNWIGCTGLGQACPGSKLPCSLSDWDCQNSYFVTYAIERYGSTYNAMLFWEANHWW